MSSNLRKDSSSSLKVVSTGSLQISPNLEALLQHDELTRRGSPTSLYHPTAGFSVSLPPPPPRYPTKKPIHAETRVNLKEIRRKKSVNGISFGSDSWPDALPNWNTPAGHASSSPVPSRSATPNPYINPTPTINTPDYHTEAASSFQLTQSAHTGSTDTVLPPAHRSDPDIRRVPPVIIPATRALSSHRSSPTLHRVEKLLNMGRESLSLLTGVAIPSHKLHNDDYIDHRPRRTDGLESGANQSSLSMASPAQQGQGSGNRTSMSHQMFAYGDTETATVSNVFPLVTETQQSSPARAKCSLSPRLGSDSGSPSISSTRSSSPGTLSPSEVAVPSGMYYASSLPHLPRMSPIEMSSLQQRASDEQQSFIDFFSSSSYPQHDLSTLPARRPSASAIMSSSINVTPSNSPLDDLPSMVFAPPSPTSASNDRPTSPVDSRPSSSLSTYSDVSAMIFAPGSPTSGPRTFPRSNSSHSPIPSYSPPEPAPPSPECSDTTATLKPPVPTTTKPLFEKRGRKVRIQKRSVSSSPQPPLARLQVPLPPTTNTLHADERADLIRRNRKLVQLLGQTPGVEKVSVVEEPRLFRMLPQPAFSALLGSAKQKHSHRHAMSVSVAVKTPNLKGESSSSWNVLDCPPSPSGRRHSTPYTPRGFTFCLDDSLESHDHDHCGPHRHWNLSNCPTSFIDLSDEEPSNDPSEVISIETPSSANGRRNHSSSTSSLVESITPEQQAEADRRRKRDKLAKLHRFLGSRVPTDLVVGNIAGPSLPPASMPEDMWLYRRMSSASALSFERVKEELSDEEKALNVKRAQKMEKLFGIPPPQTLYHTRHAPATVARSQPTSPVSSIMAPHYIPVDDPGFPRRNPNQSAYTKGKRTHRPGTSESTTFLLPFKSSNSPGSPESSHSGFLDTLTRSSVYMHYQHSIASLTDIIDRDDRESLAELHRFLHGDMVESPTDDQPLLASHRLSTSTYSHKSDRRHSLPTRTSMASISNDMIPPHRSEASDFQIRRRRAAKLTSFFGVDYRELIQDILESIEKGVEEERKRGTLRPEEVDSLLHKLRDLRMRRDGFL